VTYLQRLNAAIQRSPAPDPEWDYERDCPTCNSNAVRQIRDAYACCHCGECWLVEDDGVVFVRPREG